MGFNGGSAGDGAWRVAQRAGNGRWRVALAMRLPEQLERHLSVIGYLILHSSTLKRICDVFKRNCPFISQMVEYITCLKLSDNISI